MSFHVPNIKGYDLKFIEVFEKYAKTLQNLVKMNSKTLHMNVVQDFFTKIGFSKYFQSFK